MNNVLGQLDADQPPAKKICGPITEKVTAESMQCQSNGEIQLDVIDPLVVPSHLEFIETAEPEVSEILTRKLMYV